MRHLIPCLLLLKEKKETKQNKKKERNGWQKPWDLSEKLRYFKYM